MNLKILYSQHVFYRCWISNRSSCLASTGGHLVKNMFAGHMVLNPVIWNAQRETFKSPTPKMHSLYFWAVCWLWIKTLWMQSAARVLCCWLQRLLELLCVLCPPASMPRTNSWLTEAISTCAHMDDISLAATGNGAADLATMPGSLTLGENILSTSLDLKASLSPHHSGRSSSQSFDGR